MVLNASDSTLVVTGTCSTSPYTQYFFEASYKETGASSSEVKDIYATCVSGRHTLTVSLSDLKIRANYPGVLSIKIIGVNATNEVEGPAVNINISWPAIIPPPTISVDSSSMVLDPSASTLVVTGNCSTSSYTQYVFEATYKETGASLSSAPKRISATCASNRYTLTVTFSDLQIRATYPGVLSIKLIGVNPTPEVGSSPATISLTWQAPAEATCNGGSWNYPGRGWDNCGICHGKAAEAGATGADDTCHVSGDCCTR